MNRRRVLEILSGLAAAGSLWSCGENERSQLGGKLTPKYPNIPPLSGEPASREELHALLEELRVAFEAIGNRVSAALMPPLSESQLRESCSWFPGEIPEELYALYSWRGGQKLRENDGFSPYWFRDMIFSTPETAMKEYRSMMETYGKYSPSGDVGVNLGTCFPFAAFNGGWYVFPCGGQALDQTHPRGVVCVFQGIDVYFHSMKSMLSTCVEWVRHPLYHGKSPGWEEVEMELWRKHNPGVFER